MRTRQEHRDIGRERDDDRRAALAGRADTAAGGKASGSGGGDGRCARGSSVRRGRALRANAPFGWFRRGTSQISANAQPRASVTPSPAHSAPKSPTASATPLPARGCTSAAKPDHRNSGRARCRERPRAATGFPRGRSRGQRRARAAAGTARRTRNRRSGSATKPRREVLVELLKHRDGEAARCVLALPAVKRGDDRLANGSSTWTPEDRGGPPRGAGTAAPRPCNTSESSTQRRAGPRFRSPTRRTSFKFDGTERDSVLGTYSITEEGETTLDAPLAAYRVEDGEVLPAR